MNKFIETRNILLSLNSLPIYICGHVTPDQDSIGSCIALTEFLKKHGKTAKVLLRDSDRSEVAWQNDYSDIVGTVEQKI